MSNFSRCLTGLIKGIWFTMVAILATIGSFVVFNAILPILASRWLPPPPCPSVTSPVPQEVPAPPPAIPSASPRFDPSPAPSIVAPAQPKELSTTCFHGWICDCQDNARTCYDGKLNRNFICSYGVVLELNEYEEYRGEIYRNACRPHDWPPLKACTLSEPCVRHKLRSDELCLTKNERISTCHCGMVFDISTPQRRRFLKGIACEPLPSCEPKSESIQL